jgi:hypothetical protein
MANDSFRSSRHAFLDDAVSSELVLLRLNHSIHLPNYPQVIKVDQRTDNRITLIGYHDAYAAYDFEASALASNQASRKILQGTLLEVDIKKNVIQHRLQTVSGLSGAPLLAQYQNAAGEIANGIVGVHLMASTDENIALAFT